MSYRLHISHQRLKAGHEELFKGKSMKEDQLDVMGCRILKTALMLPVFWILAFAIFILMVQLRYWGVALSDLPEPSVAGFPVFHAILSLNLCLFPVYLLIGMMGLGMSWFGRGSIPYRMVAFFLGEVSLLLLLFTLDPGSFFAWYMD